MFWYGIKVLALILLATGGGAVTLAGVMMITGALDRAQNNMRLEKKDGNE